MLLSQKDIELVLEQCRNQGALSPRDVTGFMAAYADAKYEALRFTNTSGFLFHDNGFTDQWGGKTLTADELETIIMSWGAFVDERNRNGYRKVPVSFKSGTLAMNHQNVPRAMQNLCQAIILSQRVDAEAAYREFELIHPFVDGNGRVGHLVWAFVRFHITTCWPNTLPPNIFE